jgi:hypothetical protein
MIRLGNTGRIAVNGSYGSTTKRLEGLDEILTVTRIGLPKELRRALACTNIVENVMRSASRLPQREAMAISFNDIALDRGGDAGSSQASADCTQTTSSVTCHSGSTSHESLNSRRPCSPSRRPRNVNLGKDRSAMSTKGGTSPEITLNFEIETNQIRCDQRLIEPGKRNVGNSGCPLPSREALPGKVNSYESKHLYKILKRESAVQLPHCECLDPMGLSSRE